MNSYMFSSKKRVFITGGHGLVGSALCRYLPKRHPNTVEFYAPTSKEVNFRDFQQTIEVISTYKPDYIVHLAAKVGGLFYNQKNQALMLRDNLQINTNILNAAKCMQECRLINLLSSCIYPDREFVKYPLTENQLHIGPPHNSNYGYAYAKRMLDIQSKAYCDSYKMNIMNLIPTNIFGIEDHYGKESAHVIPALMYKIYNAKIKQKNILLKGTGNAWRQFTFADELAKYITFFIGDLNAEWEGYQIYNIGNFEEWRIKDLVSYLQKISAFDGQIKFEGNEEDDGQYQKPISTDKFDNKYRQWLYHPEWGPDHNLEKQLNIVYNKVFND